MARSKHTEVQMVAALKQMDAGRRAEDVAREVGVSKHTLYAWKAKYGGMKVATEAQEAKQLRDENARLCHRNRHRRKWRLGVRTPDLWFVGSF